MPKKPIVKRLQKTCACCGKAISVIVYSKKDYRGGHFFGKIPLYTKKEAAYADSFGLKKEFFGKTEVFVANKDPKPYGYTEYWECPRCYWGK